MKKEIVAKRYGKNLVVVVDGEKRTRVITTPEDKKAEEVIKNKITLYNKKNSKTLLEEIMYLVDTTKREKEVEEAKKKGIKKSIKKEVKKVKAKKEVNTTANLIDEIEKSNLTDADTAKLEAILAKAKGVKKQTESVPAVTATPIRKEY